MGDGAGYGGEFVAPSLCFGRERERRWGLGDVWLVGCWLWLWLWLMAGQAREGNRQG